MDRLDSALKKIKKKKEMKEAAPLAVIGKGLAVAGKAMVKGGAKAAKVGAKGAKGVKTVTPKVMGGEVKKAATTSKLPPKKGATIDVKPLGGEVAKSKKATMATKSSTPKTKYGKSKGGEMQKSQSSDITNKGKSQVDPQKNPESKPKEEPKADNVDKKEKKKKKGEDRDVVGAVSRAYGKTSFSAESKKTFREWLEQLPVEQLDETLSGEMPKVNLGK